MGFSFFWGVGGSDRNDAASAVQVRPRHNGMHPLRFGGCCGQSTRRHPSKQAAQAPPRSRPACSAGRMRSPRARACASPVCESGMSWFGTRWCAVWPSSSRDSCGLRVGVGPGPGVRGGRQGAEVGGEGCLAARVLPHCLPRTCGPSTSRGLLGRWQPSCGVSSSIGRACACNAAVGSRLTRSRDAAKCPAPPHTPHTPRRMPARPHGPRPHTCVADEHDAGGQPRHHLRPRAEARRNGGRCRSSGCGGCSAATSGVCLGCACPAQVPHRRRRRRQLLAPVPFIGAAPLWPHRRSAGGGLAPTTSLGGLASR